MSNEIAERTIKSRTSLIELQNVITLRLGNFVRKEEPCASALRSFKNGDIANLLTNQLRQFASLLGVRMSPAVLAQT